MSKDLVDLKNYHLINNTLNQTLSFHDFIKLNNYNINTIYELKYFKFEFERYNFIYTLNHGQSNILHKKAMIFIRKSFNENMLVKDSWNLIKNNKLLYNIIRYTIDIHDFTEFFYNYKLIEDNTYENLLKDKYSNLKWLIRRSTYNKNKKNILNQFYIMNILNDDNTIKNIPFIFTKNNGWFIKTDKKHYIHFDCFIDLLEYLSIKYNLKILQLNNIY